ncbi:MAG TPA: divalent-cation tolerance protein CutA [bacterium]|nr:divalent-cation tolerance protein CutA [bacterium]
MIPLKHSQPLFVLSTVAKKTDATRIAKALVGERLAACVSILPEAESHYVWKGKVRAEKELLLIIKTLPRAYERLEYRLKQLHPYECPEIVALPAVKTFDPYRRWLEGGIG